MKKIKIEIRMICYICAALGWWGFFYPELTMLPDTYAVVYEKEQTKEIEQSKGVNQSVQGEFLKEKNAAQISENCLEDSSQKEQYYAEMTAWDFDSDIYERVLNAEKGKVKFQSRFLKELKTLLGLMQNGK